MATAIAERTDIDGLEADARRRIEELQEQRARLLPESLLDGTVAAEVSSIESEIHAAEVVIERADAARAELSRRSARAQAKAEAEARAAALESAKAIEPDRLKAARDADVAIRTLGHALADLRRLIKAESEQLELAGRPALIPPTQVGYKGALMLGFTEAGLSLHDVLKVDLLEAHRRHALVDLVRPVNFEERPARLPRPPRPAPEPEKPRVQLHGPRGWRQTFRDLIGQGLTPERAHQETARMVGREMDDWQLAGQIAIARRDLEREDNNNDKDDKS